MAQLTVLISGAPPAFFKDYRDEFVIDVAFCPQVGEEVLIGQRQEFIFTVTRVLHDWAHSVAPTPRVYLTFGQLVQRIG